MEHSSLLADFVVLLAVAVGVNLLSQKVRVPPLVGFLITGVLIGPSMLGAVREPERVQMLAEIGVVALLFTTGLEFSLDRLRALRRPFVIGGSFQAIGTIAIVFLGSLLLGVSAPRSIFFGFVVTLSSTAIVLKLLADRKEVDTPQGRCGVGILIFQDFLVVPMIVLIPLLAGASIEPAAFAFRFVGGLVLLGVVVLAARYLMPRLLRVLAASRIREVFLLGSLLLILGMALLTESLQFSAALGAFLAGILLADSEYSHQIFADVLPFRDVFSSVFFIAIGMLLDVRAVAAAPWRVLGVALAIMLVKGAVVGVTVLLMKYPLRTALITGITLAQIGEFSFLLLTVQGASELLGPVAFQTFIAASVITMILTPLIVTLAPGLALKLDRLVPSRAAGDAEGSKGHVIVVGYGINGRNLANVLREVGIPHLVIELDGERVGLARKDGSKVLFGDITRREILELAGCQRASVIVFGVSDAAAVRRGVRFTRELNRTIHIIVRTRHVLEIEALYTEGADEVVAEEFETSIEIFTRVLQRLHIPRNVIEAQTRVLRGDSYEVFRAPHAGRRPVSTSVLEVLAAGATEIFLVRDSSPLVGRTVRELRIREATGATVISIVRNQASHPSPHPDFRLAGGDHLILVGGHAQIEEAFRLLEELELPPAAGASEPVF